MILTDHAKKRCQQRAISEVCIDVILKTGDEFYAGNRCLIIAAQTKSAKKELFAEIKNLGIKNTDGWDKTYIVVDENDVVLTAGHRTKKIYKH